MKAVVRSSYGSPEVLTVCEVATPIPGDREVLIRVHATTVNRTDCGILWGKPFVIRFFSGLRKPARTIPGTDFAGQVVAAGKDVTLFRLGDRVWGLDDNGRAASQAQYMTMQEDGGITTIPEHISYQLAAASAEGAHYAYNFINKVKLRSGQKVLVNGATGAIGSAAVQFLKHADIFVTAVCNTKNVGLMRSLGADKVYDYEQEDFTKDDRKYDFIFDAAGKSTFGRCKPLMKPGAVYISSELGPGGQNPLLALLTPLTGGKKVIFPIPVDIKGSLRYVRALLEQGSFVPVIDRTYPMDQIRDAYNYVATGHKTGNVMITYE